MYLMVHRFVGNMRPEEDRIQLDSSDEITQEQHIKFFIFMLFHCPLCNILYNYNNSNYPTK